jgi:hypothetical protein
MDAQHSGGYLSRVVDLPVAVAGAGVSVDVELAPGSRSRTEVAVRYAGNRDPRALARYVYDKRAPELLADVASAIHARLPGSQASRRAA